MQGGGEAVLWYDGNTLSNIGSSRVRFLGGTSMKWYRGMMVMLYNGSSRVRFLGSTCSVTTDMRELQQAVSWC